MENEEKTSEWPQTGLLNNCDDGENHEDTNDAMVSRAAQVKYLWREYCIINAQRGSLFTLFPFIPINRPCSDHISYTVIVGIIVEY